MPTSPGVTTVGLTTAHNCIAKPVSHCSSGADRLALPYSISNGQWRDTEVAWQGFPRDSSRQAQVSPPWWERPPACLSASQRGLGFSGAHWKTLLHSFQSNCEQDGGGGLKHSIQIKYPSWKLNKFRITRILYNVHVRQEVRHLLTRAPPLATLLKSQQMNHHFILPLSLLQASFGQPPGTSEWMWL